MKATLIQAVFLVAVVGVLLSDTLVEARRLLEPGPGKWGALRVINRLKGRATAPTTAPAAPADPAGPAGPPADPAAPVAPADPAAAEGRWWQDAVLVSALQKGPPHSTAAEVPLPGAQAAKYKTWIEGLLNTMIKYPSGQLLLTALKNAKTAGKIITIRPPNNEYGADMVVTRMGNDESTKPEADRTRGAIAATLKPWKPRYQVQSLQGLGNAKLEASAKIKFQDAGEDLAPDQYGQELLSALEIKNIDMPAAQRTNDDQLNKLIGKLPAGLGAGVTADQLRTYAAGTASPPNELYWAITSQIWKHMTPGAGTNAVIIFRDNSAGRIKPAAGVVISADTGNDAPEWLVLAHELIHARHIVEGTRIVHSGWEEEANTVGMRPFEGAQVTENSFRRDVKLAARNKYNSPIFHSQFAFDIARA